MYKLPKIVLVFEPTMNQAKVYEGILNSSGFIVRVAASEAEFFEDCVNVVPDIIVLNGTKDEVKEEPICKKLRKHKTFKHIPIVLLVEKIGFSTTKKAKTLNVELEEYPLKNNKFLQTVKKVSKSFFLPQVSLSEDNQSKSIIHVDLYDISEVHVSFLAPIKMNIKGKTIINAKLLNYLGIQNKNFEANSRGVLHETKHYKNEVSFKGISVEVQRELKKYITANREKK